MHFRVQTDEMNYGLGMVIRAISARPVKPVYDGVLIESNGDGLVLTCTDGEISIKATVSALVEEDDLIHIDVPARILEIVGVKGERKTPEEIGRILAERRKAWKPRPMKYRRGAIRLFAEHAVSPMRGAWLDFEDSGNPSDSR